MKILRNVLVSAVLIAGFFHGGVYAAAKEKEETCQEDIQAKFAALKELLSICKNDYFINKTQCEDLIDEIDNVMSNRHDECTSRWYSIFGVRDYYAEQFLRWNDIVNKIGCLITDDTSKSLSGTLAENFRIIWYAVMCITRGNNQKALDAIQTLKKRNFVSAQHVEEAPSSSSSSSAQRVEEASSSLSSSSSSMVGQQAQPADDLIVQDEQEIRETAYDEAAFNAQRVFDLFTGIVDGDSAAIGFVQQQALEYNRFDRAVSQASHGPEEYIIVDENKDESPEDVVAETEGINVQDGVFQEDLAAQEIIVSPDEPIAIEQEESVQKNEDGNFLRFMDEISCGAMAIGCCMGELVIPLLSKNSRFIDYGPPGLATGFFVAGAAWQGFRLVHLIWENTGATKRTLQAEPHSRNS